MKNIEEAEMILKTRATTSAEKSVTKRDESEMIFKSETKLLDVVMSF